MNQRHSQEINQRRPSQTNRCNYQEDFVLQPHRRPQNSNKTPGDQRRGLSKSLQSATTIVCSPAESEGGRISAATTDNSSTSVDSPPESHESSASTVIVTVRVNGC